MASGEDNRFSAIYTSIDGEDEYEEYEEYVEIASGPTAYLVPNRRGPAPQSSPPYLAIRPPPTKPMPLPRGIHTLPVNTKQELPPRNKQRAGTPANKMAETPLELGSMPRGKNLPPDHLPLLNQAANIRGDLQVGSKQPHSDNNTQSTPPQRLTGQKYSALSADAEVNEYASLKPLQSKRTLKLRERAKKKVSRKRNTKETQEETRQESYDAYNDNETKSARNESLPDSSRAVGILLSIIVVCVLLAIGSLITAVYAITSFEHYKANVVLNKRVVNECSIDIHDSVNNTFQNTYEQKCTFNTTENLSQSEGSTHPLSCSVRVTPSPADVTQYGATLIEGTDTSPGYCICMINIHREVPLKDVVRFTCLVTETTFGVKQ